MADKISSNTVIAPQVGSSVSSSIFSGNSRYSTIVGGTKESHMKYHKSLTAEDRDYITSVCKISYKNRTEQEKAYCADIM